MRTGYGRFVRRKVFTVQVDVNSGQAAVEALHTALTSSGVDITAAPASDSGADILLNLDGRVVALQVKTAGTVRPADVAALPRADSGAVVRVLVAHRIPQPARDALREAGWSWLDLRGHLRLRASGVLIDSQVQLDQPAPRQAAGRSWREVAFALLARQDEAVGVRPMARLLGLSPASVSQQLSTMQKANLLDRQGRALVPELFWELAGRWQTQAVPLLREPQPGDPQSLGLGLAGSHGTPGIPVGEPGWALSGTAAAAAWGAPVAASQNWPPDFLLPSPQHVARAQRLLRVSPDWSSRACTVAASPVRDLLRYEPPDSQPAPGTHWLLAHPVAVALDLAQDRARGTEILADWHPEGFRRVW